MELFQLLATIAVLGMLILVYMKVQNLEPSITAIGKTSESANKILGFF